MRIPLIHRPNVAPAFGEALEVAGLGMITAGAWVMHLAAGLIVGGISAIWVGSSLGRRP